jgi:DNA-binding transcriptional MerR regulator
MALFGLSKKNEGNEPQPASPPSSFSETQSSVPLDQVISLRQQGLSNPQIIQNLQQQGYNTSQIYDALSQADVKGTIEPQPYDQYPENPEISNPMQPDQSYYQQYASAPQYPSQASSGTEERIEEIAEAIIEEKWSELVKNVNKIIDWKEKTETRIAQLEQKMADLRNDFETLHTGVLGKVGEYDQNLTNLGAEIKAMEKVFSKILPTFTENVNELSRLSKELRAKSGK